MSNIKRPIYIITLVIIIVTTMINKVYSQYNWDWHDPIDFGFADFGDNKVLAYNLLGMGLSSLLDHGHSTDSTIVYEGSFGLYREYKRAPVSNLLIANAERGKYFKKYLSWGGGVRAYVVTGEGLQTSGVGGYIWFDWHIINSGSWRLSYGNGVGPNYFFDSFPLGGTRFNFTTHYGIKLELKIINKWLSVQFTNIHISNADIKGRDRNPALDAVGVEIGYRF